MSLEVLVLGTAAGGGLPQWNCGCGNCSAARIGKLESRLQSGVAIRATGHSWVLVNASPDLSRQVELLNCGDDCRGERFSAFCAVLLTNGDLDHSLGLFQLREGGPLTVVAPDAVRAGLEAGLCMDSVLSRYCGISWKLPGADWQALDGAGIEIRAVPIPEGGAPKYLSSAGEGVHGVGYLIREIGSPRIAGIFPDVPELTEAICAAVRSCDFVLFDGTFWTDDELVCMGYSERTSRQMGHVPVSGPGGSLEFLGSLADQTCAYLHINNTNPMLQSASNERREVEQCGVRVANDGDQFFL